MRFSYTFRMILVLFKDMEESLVPKLKVKVSLCLSTV